MTAPSLPYRVFIGYDSHEVVAYHALCASIIQHASVPVAFIPLSKPLLTPVFNRQRDEYSSTEFSFSRFMTPYLCGYEGTAVFMDCDMVMTTDIKKLFDQFDDRYAVQVVKHDYVPKNERKFLNQVQTKYEKKNWSSVMLFNNRRCTALTPEVVENESGLFLHQFKWLVDDALIGELTPGWNFLVGEYDAPAETPELLHYTLGGPYFDDYKNSDYAAEWFEARDWANSVKQRITKAA